MTRITGICEAAIDEVLVADSSDTFTTSALIPFLNQSPTGTSKCVRDGSFSLVPQAIPDESDVKKEDEGLPCVSSWSKTMPLWPAS